LFVGLVTQIFVQEFETEVQVLEVHVLVELEVCVVQVEFKELPVAFSFITESVTFFVSPEFVRLFRAISCPHLSVSLKIFGHTIIKTKEAKATQDTK